MAWRRGITFRLIDVFVGLFVVGLLIMMLLPAVSRAPNAARRMTCANNLRQSGLALLMFENTRGHLPGYLNRVGDQPACWVIPVLPHLERADLLEAWQGNKRPRPEPRVANLSFFVCPTDEQKEDSITPLSYVANSGGPDSLHVGDGPADKRANGVFHNRFDSPGGPILNLTYIAGHDGASHTLLLSENVQAGQWAGNGKYATLPSGDKIVAPAGFFTPEQAERLTTIVWHPAQAQPATSVPERRVSVGHDRDFDEAPTIDFARPSSFHSGGANVAMADSRVVFLSDEIDYGVYVALMTPDGAHSDAPDTPIAGEPGQTWRTSDRAALVRLIEGLAPN